MLEQENEQTIVSTELNTEQAEVTTVATVIEDLVVVSAENTINTATVPEEMSEPLNKVEEEVVATDLKEITNVAVEGVNSIPEALVKLENEIREEKVCFVYSFRVTMASDDTFKIYEDLVNELIKHLRFC